MAPFIKPETLKSYIHFIVLRFICMCVYTCTRVYICMIYVQVYFPVHTWRPKEGTGYLVAGVINVYGMPGLLCERWDLNPGPHNCTAVNH